MVAPSFLAGRHTEIEAPFFISESDRASGAWEVDVLSSAAGIGSS